MYMIQLEGGGAPGTPDDIYFRPNQDLKFVDRLAGSGDVRSSNMARRTDAPLPQAMKSSILQTMLSLVACKQVMMASMEQWMISMLQPETLLSHKLVHI